MTSQEPPGILGLSPPRAAEVRAPAPRELFSTLLTAVACLHLTGCGQPADTNPPAGSGQARAQLRRLVDSGRELHDTLQCAACHSPDGMPSPGATLRGLVGLPARLLSGEGRVRDEAYLTLAITDPSAEVVNGYSPSMPSYQHLDAEQVRALVHFIKSLSPGTEEARASSIRPSGPSP